ncbi:unnamed protein product, partial [Iphiclides podalirius]
MAFEQIFGLVAVIIVSTDGHPFVGHHKLDPSSRIIGGVAAPEGYAPHMAALVWGEAVKSLVCGGSIVTSTHVLTAAHCIDPMVVHGELLPSFRVVVGSNQWASSDNVAKVSRYINHPNWNPANIKNDIGVLFLAEELGLNDRVAVVPLSFDYVEGVVDSYVTGWGRVGVQIENDVVNLFPIPDDLQLLYVETISPQSCAMGLREASDKYGPAPPMDPKTEICTFHSVGHGMCNGDSGSAMVSKATGHQIGIVSWGFPCAVGAPDVFVRVSAFKEFLMPLLVK